MAWLKNIDHNNGFVCFHLLNLCTQVITALTAGSRSRHQYRRYESMADKKQCGCWQTDTSWHNLYHNWQDQWQTVDWNDNRGRHRSHIGTRHVQLCMYKFVQIQLGSFLLRCIVCWSSYSNLLFAILLHEAHQTKIGTKVINSRKLQFWWLNLPQEFPSQVLPKLYCQKLSKNMRTEDKPVQLQHCKRLVLMFWRWQYRFDLYLNCRMDDWLLRRQCTMQNSLYQSRWCSHGLRLTLQRDLLNCRRPKSSEQLIIHTSVRLKIKFFV